MRKFPPSPRELWMGTTGQAGPLFHGWMDRRRLGGVGGREFQSMCSLRLFTATHIHTHTHTHTHGGEREGGRECACVREKEGGRERMCVVWCGGRECMWSMSFSHGQSFLLSTGCRRNIEPIFHAWQRCCGCCCRHCCCGRRLDLCCWKHCCFGRGNPVLDAPQGEVVPTPPQHQREELHEHFAPPCGNFS